MGAGSNSFHSKIYPLTVFDVVIIGSGIGGLICATILAKEGMKVCVIEKNKQIGGNLQTFSKQKQIFDTGVHYIGGLGKGQNLYQIFKYLGLMGSLKLERLDEGFDKIVFSGDDRVYEQSQGYGAFIKNLVKQFPDEEKGIIAYCQKVQDTCSKFPLYHLSLHEGADDKNTVSGEGAKEVIAGFTSNKTLQAVLAGNNLLYTGVAEKTPFHIHALIVNSYIGSSWKVKDGGSQIAKYLAKELKALGGAVLKNTEVKTIVEENGRAVYVETENGDRFTANYFVSAISPAATLAMTDSHLIKPIYRKRLNELEHTISSFSLYMVFKKKTVPYRNYNYYFHRSTDVWNMNHYTEQNWPLGYGLYFTQDKNEPEFASSASALTVMRFAEVAPWQHTQNRVGKESRREKSYDTFKQNKIIQFLKTIEEKHPGISNHISDVYAATPLTNRDYIGMHDGSMYGIQKDYHDPLKTVISPRTKISNLFLTGQSINLHGILGTSLSAILTCTLLLGDRSIVDRIKNA